MPKKTTPPPKPKSPAKSPAKPSTKPPAKSPAKPKPPDEPDLEQLLTRWPELSAGQPRSLDARSAASFVLSEVLPLLTDKTLLARLATLPKTEWNPQALTDLPQAAQAVLSATTALASAVARTDSARLPEDLLAEATVTKARMMRVIDYLLADDEPIARELIAIRQGHGYLDLAQDLAQLAKLYGAQKLHLQKDRHLYQQTDEKLATTLSQRIFSELRRDEPTSERERLSQATSLLVYLYEEVAATVRWLLRKQPDEASRRFPSLFSVARRPRKKSEAPAPVPPTDPQ